MKVNFESICNYYENVVFDAIAKAAPPFPADESQELLADVACVALNRLPARYIRHEVDMSFYTTDHERADIERAVNEAVSYAIEFIQAHHAMHARN